MPATLRAALAICLTVAGLGAGQALAPARADSAGVTLPGQAAPPVRNSVSAFGSVSNLGPTQPLSVNRPLVGMAARPDATGYWLTGSDGGIYNYGAAPFRGSMGGTSLNSPVVGIDSTGDGGGYWQVAADGGVFAWGTAGFHGSMGGTRLNSPIVGIAATPDSAGYFLAAADGGVFAFGTARFHGSMGGTRLNSPVVGIAATADGGGYWLVGADGGVFNFGNAGFAGSLGGGALPAPIVAIAASSDGHGYWLVGRDGQVYAQGVQDFGSARSGSGPAGPPAVGIAAGGSTGYWVLLGDAPVTVTTGSGVAALQQALADIGFWVGPVNGVLGDSTRQAIYAFQKVEGLPRTGSMDARALGVLSTATRPSGQSHSGTVFEIDKGRQVAFFVRNGFTEWMFNISSGTGQPYTFQGVTSIAHTPEGHFSVQRAIEGWHQAPLGFLYRPRFFTGGYALHGSNSVPPFPASHGCVRFSVEAMDFIVGSGLVPIGQPVWVHA